jgi:fumarate hydratase subunit alpha
LRQIEAAQISNAVKELCLKANYCLREDVLQALKDALSIEKSETGIEILKQLVENARVAREESIPICQDTGFVTVFIEIGQEVSIVGASLSETIARGVREAYKEGYLRPSVVSDPCFSRKNTQDNTPPLIYASVVPGDGLKIIVMPKGGGSENVSQLKMLSLTSGLEGIKEFVLKVIKEAGANACPPMIIGLGIGGTFDSVGLLAKKALLRRIDKRNSSSELAILEEELLAKINNLGIGPAGLGGRVTVLSVNIETFPAHMACLPIAVNLSCYALRSAEKTI